MERQTQGVFRHSNKTAMRESKGTFKNKGQYINSILEWYFITGRASPGYHNLNSRASVGVPSASTKLLVNDNKINHGEVNQKKIKLSYTIPGTEFKIEEELNIIEDIQKFDMYEWFKTFEKIATRNKWNSEQYELILRDLISDKSLDDKIFKGDLMKIQEKIFSYVYSVKKAEGWIKKLANAKQVDFVTIKEYYEYINKYVKYYSLAYKISKDEYNRKLWEYFKNGLGENTRRKLIDNINVHNLEEYMNKLLTMEEEILNLNNPRNDSKKFETFERTHKNNYFSTQKKWCKYHKHNGHNSVDCFMNKEKGNQNHRDLPRRNEMNVMEEEKDNIREMVVRANIKKSNVDILLDSGASRSFISEGLAKRLNLKLRENKSIRTVIANGEVITTNMSTELDFKFEGVSKSYSIEPYVFDRCMYDVILGSDFLFNNNCMLDYKNKVVIVNEKIVKIIGHEEVAEKTLDEIMIERLCVVEDEKIENEDHNKVNNYTAKTKDSNVKLGRNKHKKERNTVFGKQNWVKKNKNKKVVTECKTGKIIKDKTKDQVNPVVKYRDKISKIRFYDPYKGKVIFNASDRPRKKKTKIKMCKQKNKVEVLFYARNFSTNKLNKKFISPYRANLKEKTKLRYKVYKLSGWFHRKQLKL